MPLIAIAGGSSPTLGHSIIRAITSSPNTQNNTPVILSRTAQTTDPRAPNIPTRQVDYANHASLTSALRGVHTLVSVVKIHNPADWASAQLALLRAAREAGVRRFAPSEFGMGPLASGRVDVLRCKEGVWEACVRAREESGGELEVGRFVCGGFMNYLCVGERFEALGGGGGGEERRVEALAGLEDMNVIWDVVGRKAEEPVRDDGGSPVVTLTDIWDVGKFVAAACELPVGRWGDGELGMVGETIEISRATALLEKYSGRKMEVTKVKRAEYQARADVVDGVGRSVEEVLAKMAAQFALLQLDEEIGAAIVEPRLNELCPLVEAKGVEEYLARCWRK